MKLKAFWSAFTWKVVPKFRRAAQPRLNIRYCLDLILCIRTHSSVRLVDPDQNCVSVLEVWVVKALTQCALTNLKQLLARISNCGVSDLSEHNRRDHQIELKGPNQDDAMIHIQVDVSAIQYPKDRNISFR